jgi:hypothetical protein
MNRRSFLGSLSALSAGMLLDPERLLWVPGRRAYFDIVRPRVHHYSRVFVRDSLGRVASLTLANAFSLTVGEVISVDHGHAVFTGTVTGVEHALPR